MKLRRWLSLTIVALSVVVQARAGEAPGSGSEKTRTRLTIVNGDGSQKRVLLDVPARLGAPDWSPDGRFLIVNRDGHLWIIPVQRGEVTPVDTGRAGWIDVNHGISPDGQALAFTAGGALFCERVKGARNGPAQVTPVVPSYFHGWSPDGKLVTYAASRENNLDIFTVSPQGGPERRLTVGSQVDDAPQYSPDGRFLYYVSERDGERNIWRMPATGAGPDDKLAKRVTRDDRVEAAPHPSADGRWLYFLSRPPRTPANILDRDVLIRRLRLDKDGTGTGKPEDIVRLVGGHGTLGSRPFSPDGRKLAYAAYEPPPPTVRIVLFTPSDLKPPAGVPHRLTQIADATERFLIEEMRGWKYPPAVDRLFRRDRDGMVEVVYVKGDRPSSDPYYTNASCEAEAQRKAARQLGIEGDGHVWWVFLYVGDRPKRFSGWQGGGCSRDGGHAIVNYDTIPGEIQPDRNPAAGFNAEYFLKGTIHEFGHALGLPHIGPDPALGRGNSLMGPNNDVYASRNYPKADRAYLTEASAAMLWKHPLFSGTTEDRQSQPSVKLEDYKAKYSRKSNRITLAGRLVSDLPAHTVVVLDDLGKPKDDYWHRSHAARVEKDGKFEVEIDRPARASGHLSILFCFDNGMVTGDGIGVVHGDHGPIRKSYQYRNGSYRFGD